MDECKHNWKESTFAQKYRTAGEYLFTCTRCQEYRYVGKDRAGTERSVVHQGAAGGQANTQAKTAPEAQAAATAGAGAQGAATQGV